MSKVKEHTSRIVPTCRMHSMMSGNVFILHSSITTKHTWSLQESMSAFFFELPTYFEHTENIDAAFVSISTLVCLLGKPSALMWVSNEGITFRHWGRVWVLFLLAVYVSVCAFVCVCYWSPVMVGVCVGINAKWVWVANGDYWRCIVELFRPFTLQCVLICHKHTYTDRQEGLSNSHSP